MAIDLDAFEVLRRIGKHPRLFADVRAEAGKAARALVARQLKTKSSNLQVLRDVYEALGSSALGLLLDGMSDREVAALVARWDTDQPETATAAERRKRLVALADGSAKSAAAKPGKSKKPARPKKRTASSPAKPAPLASESMAAVRQRR